jgi:hypothetical protein
MMLYMTAIGQQHFYIRKLHEHYGGIVRPGQSRVCVPAYSHYADLPVCRTLIGPNELSVNRADTIGPVLSAGGLPKEPCKHPRYSYILHLVY